MTVLLPAWLQAGAYTAEHDRFVGTALLNPGTSLTGRGGVRRVAGDEFQVTAASPASMAVQVSAGMAFVQGIYTVTQGTYTVVNDAVFQLTIGAAHSTLSRIDVVILEILDALYAGASNIAQVRIVPGTPAGTPTPPTPTGSFIVLAQLLIPPGATSVVANNITDLRPFTAGLGAPIPVRNVTERNGLPNKYDGLSVFMMDNAYELHTYAGGEWYGSTPRYYGVTSATFVMASRTDTIPIVVVDRAKIPDPGFRYTLRVDTDIETWGARLDGSVWCESTTTTSYSNLVATGQTLSAAASLPGWDRLHINRVFPQTYTGNRWVSLRMIRNGNESNTEPYQIRSQGFYFLITMIPVRSAGFVTSTSVGGQP